MASFESLTLQELSIAVGLDLGSKFLLPRVFRIKLKKGLVMFSYHNAEGYASQAGINAAYKGKSVKPNTEYLESEVERLLMITEALWSFIKDHHNLEDKELFEKIIEIDAKDGKVDGKVSASGPKNCPQCDRILPRKKPFCMYCGITVTKDCFDR